MAKGRRAASKKNPAQPNHSDGLPVNDFRHAAKRKNKPPAKITAEGYCPACAQGAVPPLAARAVGRDSVSRD